MSGNLIGTLSSIVELFPNNSLAKQNSRLNVQMIREIAERENEDDMMLVAASPLSSGTQQTLSEGGSRSGSMGTASEPRSVQFSPDTFSPAQQQQQLSSSSHHKKAAHKSSSPPSALSSSSSSNSSPSRTSPTTTTTTTRNSSACAAAADAMEEGTSPSCSPSLQPKRSLLLNPALRQHSLMNE
uniref:Uncharacterized protein n=1 Tax=Erythrolobus madagascarensis TaxID=708628 RepID=A0A7S0XJL6_9RHOD|mmetsp:Transcript_3129/g.6776  ORF Transcript_3129/g.6776 Transcript_3129/m.6776 type:complete len:184 (+) Transcript_3129:148-699(+)